MVAAKTTHGRFAMSGAPKRLAQRFVRTLCARIALTDDATLLQAYLPAGMAARLDAAPEELGAPKHPSQVAFEARCAVAGRTRVPVRLGLGRRARAARARLGVGVGVADGAAVVVLRGRVVERLAMRAETASQAPWRAAIAAARGLKRAMCAARRQMREMRNDPIGGSAVGSVGRAWGSRNDPVRGSVVAAVGQAWGSRNDPIGGTAVGAVGQAWDARNDPICGTAAGTVGQAWGSRNDPIGGTPAGAEGQTWDPRNDPIRGAADQAPDLRNDPVRGKVAWVRAAGAPLERVGAPPERPSEEVDGWAPGSPGLGEALARELEKRRLRAAVALRGNDPIRGIRDGHDGGGQ